MSCEPFNSAAIFPDYFEDDAVSTYSQNICPTFRP